MKSDIGVQIAADYLKHVLNCREVKVNVKAGADGAAIDAMGFSGRKIYLCVVAVHLNGIMRGSGGVLVKRFNKIAKFVSAYYPKKKPVYMFWAPVAKGGRGGCLAELDGAVCALKNGGINLELLVNRSFAERLRALKAVASAKTFEIKSPVMALFQIESRANNAA